MRVGRSILAVVAGALTGIIFPCARMLFCGSGWMPAGLPASDRMLLLATIYRTIYGVLGAYVAARLAPYRPMLHAIVLGCHWILRQHIGDSAHVEQRSAIWSTLVSRYAYRACNPYGVAWWKTISK